MSLISGISSWLVATDLRRDLHRYLGTGVDAKSEVELLAEIKRTTVVMRSNLVHVVSLMSAAQEHLENLQNLSGKNKGLGEHIQAINDVFCCWL